MRGYLKVHLGLCTSALLLVMLVSMERLTYGPISPVRKLTGVLLLLMFWCVYGVYSSFVIPRQGVPLLWISFRSFFSLRTV